MTAIALGGVVNAELHPPAGRRRFHLLLVRTCPWCGCAHAHRTVLAGTRYTRSPSCRPWRTYTLTVDRGTGSDA